MENQSEYLGTGTYSPDDNKLRFYPIARLDRKDYDRFRSAGYKQKDKKNHGANY